MVCSRRFRENKNNTLFRLVPNIFAVICKYLCWSFCTKVRMQTRETCNMRLQLPFAFKITPCVWFFLGIFFFSKARTYINFYLPMNKFAWFLFSFQVEEPLKIFIVFLWYWHFSWIQKNSRLLHTIGIHFLFLVRYPVHENVFAEKLSLASQWDGNN